MLRSRLRQEARRLQNFVRRTGTLTKIIPLADSIKAMLWRKNPTRILETKLRNLEVPFAFRPGTSDIVVIRKVFLDLEDDVPFAIPFRTIVDAGAHIGAATLFYHHRFPEAQILAIEPEKSNYQLLRRNTEAISNVLIVRAALWPREEQIWIRDASADKSGFQVCTTPSDFGYSVPSITPQKIFEKLQADRIDLLKLDIEGTELDLFLNGADQWLSRVQCLVLELHDRMRPGCAQSLYAALQRYNFVQEIRGENIFILLGAKKSNG